MRELFIAFLIIAGFKTSFVDGCQVPFADGTWLSTTRGTWTVTDNSTKIGNFEADLSRSLSTVTLTCVNNTGTLYILGTSFEIFFNVFIDVYTCMDIQPITATDGASYVYYMATATDTATGEQFTSDVSSTCSNTNYDAVRDAHLVVHGTDTANASINFPNVILGNYTVNYTDIDHVWITDSLMDSCSDTKVMTFNNSDTNTNLAFTSSNMLQCLYWAQDGSEFFVHTYNNDSSVDNTNTHRFACWVFAYSDSGVSATVYPKACQLEQSSTSVPYGGQTYNFQPYFTCPIEDAAADDSGLEAWMIVLIVLACLLLIALIVVCIMFLVMKRQERHVTSLDEEQGIIKGERHPSPDSLHDEDIIKAKKKAQAEYEKELKEIGKGRKKGGYTPGFDETDLKKDKNVRERTFDLVEVKKQKGAKLGEGRPAVKDDTVGRAADNLGPRVGDIKKVEKTQDGKPAVGKSKDGKPAVKGGTPRDGKLSVKDTKPLGKSTETVESVLESRPNSHKDARDPGPSGSPAVIIAPTGKQSIPPTAPRPGQDDSTLIRVKKERERKEKERKEREQKIAREKERKAKKDKKASETKVVEPPPVIVHKSSSSEYETDEEIQAERIKKIMEQRKRLQQASYEPPTGVTDAKVVGKKRRSFRKEGDDIDESGTKLISREQQEKLDREKRERKKAMRRLAKHKLHPESAVGSDSDAEEAAKRRRQAGDPHGREAPYIEQYYVKKDIEEELDSKDYWTEKSPAESFSQETLKLGKEAGKAANKPEPGNVERATSRVEPVIQDNTVPPLDMSGVINIEFGPNGELPDEYIRDKDGNILRKSDGKLVVSGEMAAKQIDFRRKNVFGLPRLIRDNDGRPVGGYKDDEFGPTAEWDYGDATEDVEPEEEQGKPAARGITPGGRQVSFVREGETSRIATPGPAATEMEYNQIRGRQLSSEDRDLLQQRLFEQKGKPSHEHDKHLPVYVVKKGGVKPESIYIDNTQIERQDQKPVSMARSATMRAGPPAGMANMVKKSDSFSDGRRTHLHRNSKLRATWTGREAFVHDGIPEETEDQLSQGHLSKKRNIGSDDEFVLVGGSMKKMSRPAGVFDSHLCPRYERHGYPGSREETMMSDISMRTAPDSVRPLSGNDPRLKNYLEELYKDKKYFDYYINTEGLPTNAAVETRGLANHGRDFLLERAEYWREHQPEVPPHPPPSALGLHLSRMQTLYTIADSGRDSMISTDTERPYSADDVHGGTSSRRTRQGNTRENTRELTLPDSLVAPSTNRSERRSEKTNLSQVGSSAREPPTGRSEKQPSSIRFEDDKKQEQTTDDSVKAKTMDKRKGDNSAEKSLIKPDDDNKSQKTVLTLTDV